MEKGEVWPTLDGDGRPYDFVCQVNLRDCPERPDVPFDSVHGLPPAWLLEEAARPTTCLVRTYRDASPDKAVVVPRPPAVDPDDYRVRPCGVRTERSATVSGRASSGAGRPHGRFQARQSAHRVQRSARSASVSGTISESAAADSDLGA